MPQKAQRGSRYKVPVILNLGRFVTGKDPRIMSYRRLGGPQSQF